MNCDINHNILGNPEVTLHAADSNIPVPVMISLAGEKIWRAAYTIAIPGNYLLSVLWAGRPVKGCPLIVEAKGGADASKVFISYRNIMCIHFSYFLGSLFRRRFATRCCR